MKKTRKNVQKATMLAHSGRGGVEHQGVVNPPVYHASTVLFPDLATLRRASESPHSGVYYGRFGTPTQFALEAAYSDISGAAGTISVGNGLAAISVVLNTLAEQGKHLLVADNVYQPTRRYCDEYLAKLGVETEYFDASDPVALADRIRGNTAGVFVESPGSLTFELTDIPAVAGLCESAAIPLVLDNTWATPLYFAEFEHGVNISINAATKYVVGHADAMLGLIACDAKWFEAVRSTARLTGQCAAPDDAYLGLRGLRTLSVRLAQHQQQAQKLCDWLAQQPEVEEILWPAWHGHPDHALWQRDFTGAGGLFSVVLQELSEPQLAAMLDGMQLFGMGFSWGGFESLILPVDPAYSRTVTSWKGGCTVLRIHAGLEASEDLIADLKAAFDRLRRTD